MNVPTVAAQTFTEARETAPSLSSSSRWWSLSSLIFTEVTSTTMDRVLKDTGLAAINVFVSHSRSSPGWESSTGRSTAEHLRCSQNR
jgi:hypothetical protein